MNTETVENWPEILGAEVRDGYVIRDDGVGVLPEVQRQDCTGG